MSYELSEEQQLIQQNAREFAQDYLALSQFNWTSPTSIRGGIQRMASLAFSDSVY